MQTIPIDAGLDAAFDALLNDRLVLLVGAGLSMAPPSSLPSAATIARHAKQKYESIFGVTRAPLPENIEAQAEFFFGRNELPFYFHKLIDPHAFASPSNPGHHAIADLLLVKAVHTAVTTNVDVLIETAGYNLFGEISVGIDGDAVAALPLEVAPLLKIHGCRVRDINNMVWAPSQLRAPPVKGRITSSAAWLDVRLRNRDLVIVGYATDWDYLNEVLASTLGVVTPSKVIVVDIATAEALEAKAPELCALGVRAATAFVHVQSSGSDFLDALRRRFSETFVRGVLHSGITDFIDLFGAPPAAALLEPPPDLENTTLWSIRRDLEGRLPNEPAEEKTPQVGGLLGVTILQLRNAGASPDGRYWRIQGKRVRILRTADKLLHRVQVDFDRDTAPAVAPDIIIAVGADAYGLPPNVARPTTAATIARGSTGRWMTRRQALEELIPS